MRTGVFKQTGALVVGTVVGGLLAYVFFALATRSLGARDAAPVSVLWTYWTVAAAILTFPLQHWTIRLLTEGAEGTLRSSLARIWIGTAVVSAVAGVVSYLGRDTLFHDDGIYFPLMIAALTAGAALSGLVRGGLAGRGRYAATGSAIAIENGVRVALATALAITDGSATAFGFALVIGSAAALVWPSSLRFDARDASDVATIRSPLALASGLAAGSLIAQIVLTGGPVVLAMLAGAPEQVTSLFVTMAVWRAPYLISLGVAPQLTAILTRLKISGEDQRLHRVRKLTLLTVVGAGAVAFLAGATILKPILRLVFGPEVILEWHVIAWVGTGTVVAIGNLALLLMMLAVGTSKPVNRAWIAAVAVAAIVLAVLPTSPLERVVTAFVSAQATAFVLLMMAPLRTPTAGGSPDADVMSPAPIGT